MDGLDRWSIKGIELWVRSCEKEPWNSTRGGIKEVDGCQCVILKAQCMEPGEIGLLIIISAKSTSCDIKTSESRPKAHLNFRGPSEIKRPYFTKFWCAPSKEGFETWGRFIFCNLTCPVKSHHKHNLVSGSVGGRIYGARTGNWHGQAQQQPSIGKQRDCLRRGLHLRPLITVNFRKANLYHQGVSEFKSAPRDG